MTVTYRLTETLHPNGPDTRRSYGIAAYADAGNADTAVLLFEVHDITSDRARLGKLVQACNRLKLSSVHLRDVVDDFLGS